MAGRSRQCFVFPWMNPCDIATTPAWVNDTVDYTKIDPLFGDETVFKELVTRAHERGIRV